MLSLNRVGHRRLCTTDRFNQDLQVLAILSQSFTSARLPAGQEQGISTCISGNFSMSAVMRAKCPAEIPFPACVLPRKMLQVWNVQAVSKQLAKAILR